MFLLNDEHKCVVVAVKSPLLLRDKASKYYLYGSDKRISSLQDIRLS